MAYKTLLVEKKEGIAVLTLNRPQVLNAISSELLRELKQAMEALKDDPEVKVVVIKGAGDKAFSAGTDVREAAKLIPAAAEKVGEIIHEAFNAVRFCPKPVVCAVNGYCLGAAVELMVCCDIVIASDTAQFAMPEINIGIPSIVEAAILPMVIGIFRAKELVLAGEYWDARKADKVGLVNEVVPAAQFEKRVWEVARNLASKDALALAVQKDICNKWMTTDLETAIDYSILAIKRTEGTKGQVEGMAAFLERRKARPAKKGKKG